MGRARRRRGAALLALGGALPAALLPPGAAGTLLGPLWGASLGGCSLGRACAALGGSCSARGDCGGLWVPKGCGMGFGGCGCCHPPSPDSARSAGVQQGLGSDSGSKQGGFVGAASEAGPSPGDAAPPVPADASPPLPLPPPSSRPAPPRPAESEAAPSPPLRGRGGGEGDRSIELLLADLLRNLTVPFDGRPVKLTPEKLLVLLEGVGVQLDAPIEELLESGQISGGVNDTQIVLDFQDLLGVDTTVSVDCTVGCEVLTGGAASLPLLQYYFDQQEAGGTAYLAPPEEGAPGDPGE